MSTRLRTEEGSKPVDEAEIRERYEKVGQGHVLKYLSEVSDDEKAALLSQLRVIPVEKLEGFLKAALDDQNNISSSNDVTPFSKQVGRTTDKEASESAYNIGIEAIRCGEVAALVLAGGQGTRLGFSGPKGMYNIGLPSGRSLFQLLSERILKLRKLASNDSDKLAELPFFIMTSPINHEETVDFFEKNDFFGLPKDDVRFFEQGMLPCLTEDGKIIMETSSKVAMAPDGNGGIYPSLHNSGMLGDMDQRGIKHLHIFSIDNALTKPADPVFIGHCISQRADCGNKVVWKAGAHEKVGVIAEKHGKSCVVEYSDITEEMAERIDSNGRLVFGAGNICNHYYTLDFLKDVVLPKLGNMYHIARKKIPYYDEGNRSTVTPTTDNGIKLESFIFDVFPFAAQMAVLDVLREDEFAPVKNAPGSSSDSPETAREYISKLAKKWVVDAGGILKGGSDESISEVAPLTSYGGEGLEDVKGKEIVCPFSL
jgi:UDP-N-acetylglucosamine/UDP-N-acetylgalactosamine diphosphorylase